jgi:hypothetical protein
MVGWFVLFSVAHEAVGDPKQPILFWLSIALGVVYWCAGIFYLVWLWRLAIGLRRSWITWILGTLLATSVLYFFAWWIAWANMRRQVKRSFHSESESLLEAD